jgi:predicted nucleic acid-binding protein
MAQVRYVLDTDTVTYQQAGRATILRQLSQIDPAIVATTVVTLYEQLRGRLAVINRQQDDQARQVAYRRLQETHGYFCRCRCFGLMAMRLRPTAGSSTRDCVLAPKTCKSPPSSWRAALCW